MSETPDRTAARDLMVLVDPAAEPDDDGSIPTEFVIGGWEVDENGVSGRFLPNPEHIPSGPDVPSDPVDAVLRGMAGGDTDGDDVLAALGDIGLAVGHDAQGSVTVAPGPQGVPCVLATTAPRHCPAAAAAADPPVAEWRLCSVADLAAILPPQGIDVLFNPLGPAPMRVSAADLRQVAARAAGEGGVAAPETGSAGGTGTS
ncbi:type VII secretion system-associated protein [Pseudonocardia sp. ICBG1293]|uniref:type VII secretion system-associated protein n=1 Tax=Pseudonocardia sp. ICBG1293 TaxID=2844382 RepID=UPI001CCC2016|nr:type VII secretion system-associated protein [Pseudonocardia sp. ICBG1293]